MDLNFLVKKILPQRAKELEEGKNLATRNPIYVVLELEEHVCSGHSEFTGSTNHSEKNWEFGYIDMSLDLEDRDFQETDEAMIEPEPVSRFWTDNIVAFFLTMEAANDYLQYQSRNLLEPYIYVFSPGYGNRQMNLLFGNE
jgi:hypothetical protein